MKKRQYYLAILSVCGLVLLGGCGKNNSKPNRSYNSNSNSNYTPSTTPVQTTTAAPENAPTVNLNNLTVIAGSEIDYMSAIESVENMDLSKSMVSINSSGVDRFTPGNYTVYYTFDYMGYTVKSFIVLNVLENPEKETTPAQTATKTSTEETSETESFEQTSDSASESSASEASSESETETTSASGQMEDPTSSSTNANGALDATVYHPDLPIPDAVFTLSTGEVVTIKNTPERYIVETFTDDIYYTEDEYHYLRSELKVLMNTGEVQTVEMVITRVNEIPEENSDSNE